MNTKSVIMLCFALVLSSLILCMDKIQAMYYDTNIISLDSGNVRVGKVYDERVITDYVVTNNENNTVLLTVTAQTNNIYDEVLKKLKLSVDAENRMNKARGKDSTATLDSVSWNVDVTVNTRTYIKYKSNTQADFDLTIDNSEEVVPKSSQYISTVIAPLKTYSKTMMDKFNKLSFLNQGM